MGAFVRASRFCVYLHSTQVWDLALQFSVQIPNKAGSRTPSNLEIIDK